MTHAELIAAGYDVDAAAYHRLEQFVSLLLKENRRLNLTSIRSPEQAWTAHVCDSLALLPLISEAQPRRLLDLGAGGGLPSVPLACACSDLDVTLLEATQKKQAAVQRIVAKLELNNVRFATGRAETLAHDPAYRERFDAVTARAVGHLRMLVEYASGFVRPAGLCWFFKTAHAAQEEITAAKPAAQTCALHHIQTRPYRLPTADAQRVIVVYRKHEPLRADLPRPAGRPKKRPL